MNPASQSDESLLVAYSGTFLEGTVPELVQALEKDRAQLPRYRHLVEAVIEMGQNIRHHGRHRPDGPWGELWVYQDAGHYRLVATNPLQSGTIVALRRRLNGIARLSADEARERVRQTRRETPPPHSPGAGLGLLLLRQRATQFLFKFDKDTEGAEWLRFSVVLDK